ncbi:MAG: TIGR00300 family protein [Bacteroidota bacterium]
MPSEEIELAGHIIDSLILPRVLDTILDLECDFNIEAFQVGVQKTDPSYARLRVSAPTPEKLSELIESVQRLGAAVVERRPVRLVPAEVDGVFPRGFYATTNLETWIYLDGTWVKVDNAEMDCGIVYDPVSGRARALRVAKVKRGDLVVVGHEGVRVTALERSRAKEAFEFMTSQASSEKPKQVLIHEVAQAIRATRDAGRKILFVAGPAVIHTGCGRYLTRLIEAGFLQVLFAGNALAVHDIESALYGTSLGVSLATGAVQSGGHEHHLRAINEIRRAGSIPAAVAQGFLTQGVMHACVTHGVDYVLAGSIRDDGPLPDVITDVVAAQDAMRAKLDGVGLVVALASMLHTIATGNMLPAGVRFIAVDINPAVATKLADRGSFQNIGIVTDVESFLRDLCEALAPLS